MKYDRHLHISTGGSRKTTVWQQSDLMWSEFCEKVSTPQRSPETYEEYMALKKTQQDALKDVGGFVGGTLTGGRRKSGCVEGRDLVTLDLDRIPTSGTDDVLKRVLSLQCAAAVYSTRKHSGYAPRMRVIIPLDRTCTADEYEPIARKLAGMIGIQMTDPTTFEDTRLMYWPSASSDGEFVFQAYDSPFCSASGVLGLYSDWHDVTEWPANPEEGALEKRTLAKQTDPTTKEGPVGAFCRTYGIEEAMDIFIPGMYEPTDKEGRYTYTGGSTTGGAIVYEGDLFLYSHHATDPCGGQLVNAWDLIRLHKFGAMDADAKEGTPVGRMPSYAAMREFALSDSQTADRMARERLEKAQDVFSDDGEIKTQVEAKEEAPDLSWMSKLSLDGNGNYKKTINNVILILKNDPKMKGKIVTDEFAGCGLATGSLPWDTRDDQRRWTDNDDAGVQWYMETFYNIPSRDKILAALSIVGGQHMINEVRDYLFSLEWDGEKRIDTLLPDYLGAVDTIYTRAVMRKSLTAAVARAIEGGVKYDYMPIFSGPQGIGKSTFLATLGCDWFSDSLTAFEGKEAAELIQGTWIDEIPELNGFTKYETSAIKQFLSKRSDIYRAAYGRRTEEHPRRCVFFGTCNDSEFLKDATGNRRFWPVDVGIREPIKSVWDDLPGEVDQIWAEAVVRWRIGEKLYLTGKEDELARAAQEEHREASEWEGMIRDFLESEVPLNWDHLDLQARRIFLQQGPTPGMELMPLDKVCIGEIWVEVLGGDLKKIKTMDRKTIGGILERAPGWTRNKSMRRYGPYGRQKGFERLKSAGLMGVSTKAST